MAYNFDGVDDVISMGSASPLDDLHLAAFSAHAWIYPETTGEGATGRIFNKRVNEAAGGWIFFTDDTESLGAQTVSSAAVVRANSRGADNACSLNAWHSVVLTYNDAGDRTLRIYVDGTEISYATQTAAAASNGTDTTGNLLIGNNVEATRTFDGRIAEAALWSRVISAAEITALARGFSPLFFRRGAVLISPMVRTAADRLGIGVPSITGAVDDIHVPHVIRPAKPLAR